MSSRTPSPRGERMASWVQARQAEAVATLTRRPEMQPGRTAQTGGGDGRQFGSLNSVPVTAADLCMVWPWIKPQAERVVSTDVMLVERFPDTHRVLAAGRIDVRRARIIVDELNSQDDDVAALIEAAVIPHVHAWTSVKLTRVIRRLIHELAPHTAKKRHREAREKRDVFIEPAPDGMAWLHAYLPAEQAAAIMAVLNAAGDAEKNHDCARSQTCQGHPSDDAPEDKPGDEEPDNNANQDKPREEAPGSASDPNRDAGPGGRMADHGCKTRTPAQRRADALASLAWSSLSTGYLGGSGCANCGSPFGTPLAQQHGRPVSVHLTMAFSTWIGLDEHPAELDGYGPVDADVGRKLAAAGVWRWLLTDPAGGYALDYGRTRYTPPQDLVDFVLLRDRECIMPGCHQPAYRCEIDHRLEYPAGPTAACNCSALCKSCHVQKHRAGWSVEQLAPGVHRWTSPSGHQQVVRLPRIAPPVRGPSATNPPPATGPPVPDVPPF